MTRDYSRQSFLGSEAERIFAAVKVGIIGAGGGGSHIAQQLAHIGLCEIVIVDSETVDNSNLNRLVGATWQDVMDATPKVQIAERAIKAVNPNAHPIALQRKWQEVQLALRDCTAFFGCVDSYTEREQLERFARRFGIVYIDVGMDVFPFGEHFSISGQMVVSMLGFPCLRCMGIISDDSLEREAGRYGAAGFNPQVVWPNGVLASAAVGAFIQLVTPWHPTHQPTTYLEYDGNSGTLTTSNRIKVVQHSRCTHFSDGDVGDPYFAS